MEETVDRTEFMLCRGQCEISRLAKSRVDNLPSADRSKYLGDPDFVDIPVKALTSKAYARALVENISLKRARPSDDIFPETSSRTKARRPPTTRSSTSTATRSLIPIR